MRIADQFAGKHFVLTGVTGFLGKVWLAHVLEYCPEVGRVTVVVRGRGPVTPVQRVEQIIDTSPVFRTLRERHGAQLGRWLGERLDVVDGDVEKPRCGIDGTTSRQLAETVDAVVHCAGLTDFEPDPQRALKVNVLGARHAAALARALGARLVHVSTCYTAGVADGEVPESIEPGVSPNGTRFDVQQEMAELKAEIHTPKKQDRIDRAMARAEALGWPNIYTYTKGLAEHLIASRRDVPFVIVRPAIVECAWTYPFEGWNEGLNTAGPLAWLISQAFRRFPTTPEHRFDVVPVDEVVRGLTLALAALLRDEAPEVVQLGSSWCNPLTFERAVELTGLGARRWTRRGHGTAMERSLFRYLDPVPARKGSGWFLPFSVRGGVELAEEVLDAIDEPDSGVAKLAAALVGDQTGEWRSELANLRDSRRRIEDMLRVYRPFTVLHDYQFRTDHVARLSAALDSEDVADFAWRMPELCWRRYWIDIEYPGLSKWSIPIIRGHKVPMDPPGEPVFRLQTPAKLNRQASK